MKIRFAMQIRAAKMTTRHSVLRYLEGLCQARLDLDEDFLAPAAVSFLLLRRMSAVCARL